LKFLDSVPGKKNVNKHSESQVDNFQEVQPRGITCDKHISSPIQVTPQTSSYASIPYIEWLSDEEDAEFEGGNGDNELDDEPGGSRDEKGEKEFREIKFDNKTLAKKGNAPGETRLHPDAKQKFSSPSTSHAPGAINLN
jgi:hypothetical protein